MSRPVTLFRSDSDNENAQMQAPASNINENEVDCGITNIPCCFGHRRKFQQMATWGRFLVFMVLLCIALAVLEGYLYASAKLLTNTFQFPPSLFDLLFAMNGLFQGVVAIFVAYWGKRIHRPAWLGGLTCLLGAFCLVTIIPYIGPSRDYGNSTSVAGPRLCARESAQLTDESDGNKGGVAMLVALGLLLVFFSLVNVSFWSHGLTYIDDSVESHKTPIFIGFLLGLRLSMISNGYSIQSAVSSHPQLWWVPLCVIGVLLMAVGAAIASFPLRLLSTIVRQTAASILDIVSGNSTETLEQVHAVKKEEELWPTLKRIFTNKIIVLDTLALSLFATAVINFNSYENAFLQAQYHIPYTNDFVDPWTSRKMGDLFKTIMITLLTAGAGLSFARIQPGSKKMASFILAMGIHTAVIYFSFIFLDCKTSSIVGEQGTRYFTPLCSHDCRCRSSEVIFEPVCIIEGSQTYFSPCHAGCTTSAQINNIFVYGNCSCGPQPDYVLGAGPPTAATRGACSAGDCFGLWTLFQVFYILNIALAASTLVAHLLLALRSARPSDRAAAAGLVLAAGALPRLPGHFLYKLISDMTCQYWNADGYTCNLHTKQFADILSGVSAGIVLVSCVLNVVVLRIVRNQESEDRKKVLQEPNDRVQESEEEIDDVRSDRSLERALFRTTQI